jgi:hypothetical protein
MPAGTPSASPSPSPIQTTSSPRSIYHRRGYRDSGQGEFPDGYHYHDAAGVRRYHGEQHVYLVKRLNGAGS